MCLGQIRQRSEDTLIAGTGCDCITDPQLKLLQRALQMYILTCRVKVSRQLKSEKKKTFGRVENLTLKLANGSITQ